jgi:GT2 family glycosyltransferase
MNAAVDVVIVNWNSGVQLRACIDSIAHHGAGLVGKTIIVDNGSIDGSDLVADSRPGVSLIRAGENLGFGRACNRGASHARSEFLLFLNPDAALQANTLQTAMDFMTDPVNSAIAICGVQLKDDSGHVARSCTRFPRELGLVAHAVGLTRLVPRWGYFMADWSHAETREVDHVIGAFFLVRRRVFEQIGGFDERFFLYLEDLDFSYRARKVGFRSVYLAGTQAFHAGGGTSKQVKARRLFYSLRSRLLYAFKHFSWAGALLVLLATVLIEPLSRSALALGRRSWSGLKETWEGYGMLWKWLPQWLLRGVTR